MARRLVPVAMVRARDGASCQDLLLLFIVRRMREIPCKRQGIRDGGNKGLRNQELMGSLAQQGATQGLDNVG